jgi:hypothetical protein
VTKHIENDQNDLAVRKTKQIPPEDFRPLPTAAGKEWDSAVVFYQCKAAAESTRGVSLKSKPYFTTGPRDAAQRMTFEKMYRSLTLAEKFLPLELRAY